MEWKDYWETLPEDFKEFAKDNVRMQRCMMGTEEIPSRYVDIFNGKAHPDFRWDVYFQMQDFFKNYKDPLQKSREADPLYLALRSSQIRDENNDDGTYFYRGNSRIQYSYKLK